MKRKELDMVYGFCRLMYHLDLTDFQTHHVVYFRTIRNFEDFGELEK